MRRIICALIIAGLSLALSACDNSERRVKIKDGAAVLADVGLKVTLPQGWVVFDTEESMDRDGTVIREFSADYYIQMDYANLIEADTNARPWESRFLLYAERPGGGIALTLRTCELPREMNVYDFARGVNNTVMIIHEESGFVTNGTLEPIPNGESTGIAGYISEVSVKNPKNDNELIFVLTYYIFTYKGDMYCMEILAGESAVDEGKNIQILPAEL